MPEIHSHALHRGDDWRAARLVLIETRELAWHRARYRAERCVCAPADPLLVSLRTLRFGSGSSCRRRFDTTAFYGQLFARW